MSEQARDVVRYIKAIEDTGGYKTIIIPSFGGIGYQIPVSTADRRLAESLDLADAFTNAMAAIRLAKANDWEVFGGNYRAYLKR